MRRLGLFLALAGGLGVGVAHADRPVPRRYVVPSNPDDFWRDIVQPHAEEVADLQRNLASALRSLDEPYAERSRGDTIRSGLRMARYARQLDPGDVDARYYAGAFADEAGRAIEAQRLLEDYLQRAPAGVQRADALLRLGRIALRQQRASDAIAFLRRSIAQPAERPIKIKAHIALAHALEASGDVGAAVAVLRELNDGAPMDGDPASVIGHLALAVLYDRDEQITAAFDVIVRLKNALDADYSHWAEDAVRTYPPPIGADLHYYRAFVYETTSRLPIDARAEWLAYERVAGASGQPGAAVARARDHRRALDEELARDRRPAPPPRRRPR